MVMFTSKSFSKDIARNNEYMSRELVARAFDILKNSKEGEYYCIRAVPEINNNRTGPFWDLDEQLAESSFSPLSTDELLHELDSMLDFHQRVDLSDFFSCSTPEDKEVVECWADLHPRPVSC